MQTNKTIIRFISQNKPMKLLIFQSCVWGLTTISVFLCVCIYTRNTQTQYTNMLHLKPHALDLTHWPLPSQRPLWIHQEQGASSPLLHPVSSKRAAVLFQMHCKRSLFSAVLGSLWTPIQMWPGTLYFSVVIRTQSLGLIYVLFLIYPKLGTEQQWFLDAFPSFWE